MTTAMTTVFSGTIQKSEEWLYELMNDLGWEDPHRAYAALRSTLHALRDRLTVDESAKLAAQLPLLIRGVFDEGWRPTGKPERIRSRAEFIGCMEREYRYNFDAEPEGVIRAVLHLLSRPVTEGEISDVIANLPHEIRELWP